MLLINPNLKTINSEGFYLDLKKKHYAIRFVHSDNAEKAGDMRNRPKHRHSLYHIILIRRGQGSFVIEGKSISLVPGTLVFISPGMQHSVGLKKGEEVIYGEITFEFLDEEGEQLNIDFSSLLTHLSGDRLNIPLSLNSEELPTPQIVEGFINQFAALRNIQDKKQFFHMGSSALLSNMLIALAEQFILLQKDKPDISPMEKIRNYIERNYLLPLTLNDLGNIGSLSNKYISRRFKELYGDTPIRFRDNLRIEAAGRLLKNSNYSIGEIAEKCGFTDIYYFSKIFKKRTGKTPGKYRESIRSSF